MTICKYKHFEKGANEFSPSSTAFPLKRYATHCFKSSISAANQAVWCLRCIATSAKPGDKHFPVKKNLKYRAITKRFYRLQKRKPKPVYFEPNSLALVKQIKNTLYRYELWINMSDTSLLRTFLVHKHNSLPSTNISSTSLNNSVLGIVAYRLCKCTGWKCCRSTTALDGADFCSSVDMEHRFIAGLKGIAVVHQEYIRIHGGVGQRKPLTSLSLPIKLLKIKYSSTVQNSA
jgi:hypothetical protein